MIGSMPRAARILAVFLCLALLACSDPHPADSAAVRDVRAEADRLHEVAMEIITTDRLARKDGSIFAVDIGQLAHAAATARDLEMYRPLRRIILEELLVDDPQQDYTNGFIKWRYHPTQPADATGTTEALRAAQALLAGADAWPDRFGDDRDTVLLILHGYARHAGEDQGVWLIRNYYNLNTKAFATNSFTIDYDPDFITAAASEYDDDILEDVARRSVDLVRHAVTPAGVIHSIIQPELLTLMWIDRGIFSPNNLEQLSNVAAIAERSVETSPDVARGVLRFAMDALERDGELHLNYDATTGLPAGFNQGGVETYAPLLRLAVALDDREAHDRLLHHLLRTTPALTADRAGEIDLAYLVGESWSALRASLAYTTG